MIGSLNTIAVFLSSFMFIFTGFLESRAQPLFSPPRGTALARANIAEVSRMENFFQNPSSLAFVDKGLILVGHIHGNSETPMSQVLSGPLLLTDQGTIAASFSVSNIAYTTISNWRKVTTYSTILGGGYEIFPRVGIGTFVKLTRATNGIYQTQSASSSFGLLYSPSPSISYAAVFQGIGNGIMLTKINGLVDIQPQTLQRSIHVGISMRYPSPVSLRKPVLALSMSNEKILSAHGLIYRGGIEFYPIEFLALRFGYAVGVNDDIPSYGTGLSVGIVQLDYAFSKEAFIGGTHEASILLEL